MKTILFLAAALACSVPAFAQQTPITPPPSGHSGSRFSSTDNPPAGQPVGSNVPDGTDPLGPQKTVTSQPDYSTTIPDSKGLSDGANRASAPQEYNGKVPATAKTMSGQTDTSDPGAQVSVTGRRAGQPKKVTRRAKQAGKPKHSAVTDKYSTSEVN